MTPIQTTPNRKLALVIGRFTAEDAVITISHYRIIEKLCGGGMRV
jgi:hypothetical protein